MGVFFWECIEEEWGSIGSAWGASLFKGSQGRLLQKVMSKLTFE